MEDRPTCTAFLLGWPRTGWQRTHRPPHQCSLAALAPPPRRPSRMRYSALSPSPKSGRDAADTHVGLVSGQEWSETKRWRRHAGSWFYAAETAMPGARQPPWLRRRQAGEDTRPRFREGGGAGLRPPPRMRASLPPAHPPPPAPGRIWKQDTRGPGNSKVLARKRGEKVKKRTQDD